MQQTSRANFSLVIFLRLLLIDAMVPRQFLDFQSCFCFARFLRQEYEILGRKSFWKELTNRRYILSMRRKTRRRGKTRRQLC